MCLDGPRTAGLGPPSGCVRPPATIFLSSGACVPIISVDLPSLTAWPLWRNTRVHAYKSSARRRLSGSICWCARPGQQAGSRSRLPPEGEWDRTQNERYSCHDALCCRLDLAIKRPNPRRRFERSLFWARIGLFFARRACAVAPSVGPARRRHQNGPYLPNRANLMQAPAPPASRRSGRSFTLATPRNAYRILACLPLLRA